MFRLLKQGNSVTLDNGQTISPDDVLLPPDEPLYYSYCSDTCYNEHLVDYIQDRTIIYHESTFLHDMQKRAKATAHSTALQAAQIASKASVKHLLLGHFSARYKDLEPFLTEARSVFPDTSLAKEGQVHKLKEYG